MSSAAAPQGSVLYLTFRLAGEEYAAPLPGVREILRYEGATRVPGVPAWVRGVVNLRGSVVPAIDLARWLGLDEARPTPLTCLLIVEAALDGEPSTLGLVVDSVDEVLEVRPEDVEPTPSFATPVAPEFLLGLARSEGRFALLLDLDRVLARGLLQHDLRSAGRAAQ